MGVEDIKEVWGRITAGSSDQQVLDEEQIRALLGKRSKNLMERIDFNIRVGFFILLGAVSFIILYDICNLTGWLPTGQKMADIPVWVIILDFVINFLIITIFITFFIHYFKIRSLCRNNCDIRHSLLKVIGILTMYQRLFVITLVIIMLSSTTGFLAGYFTSVQAHQTSEGFLLPVILFGFLLIAIWTYIIFLLLRWIFRKVYGNYLARLRETLAELDELKD
jgi:hypothetical protein